MKRECETCIKRKTTYCPNSIECMDTNDMPYYQNRIMLLEENQELKKQVEEINKMIEKCGFVNIEQVMLNYCGLLSQQKEFISYLENEIKSINPEHDIEEVYRVHGYEVMLNYTTLVEILQKCRSIMGVSDENRTTL